MATDFFTTVETDVKDAVRWAETEVDSALVAIWNVAKPLFVAAEPTVILSVLQAAIAFWAKLPGLTDLAEIEAAFLNEAEALGGELLAQAQALGSDLLQVLLALAKNA